MWVFSTLLGIFMFILIMVAIFISIGVIVCIIHVWLSILKMMEDLGYRIYLCRHPEETKEKEGR